VNANNTFTTRLDFQSNQIKFIKSRRTKLITDTAITVAQHDTTK